MPVLASAVFDLVDRIAAATTVHEVWSAYLGASRKVGLPFGAAAYMPADKNLPPQVIADALPPGWLDEYYARGLSAGDLLTERARRASTSFEWSIGDWDIEALSPEQQRWRDHNLHHGVLGGLIVLDFRRGENMVMVVCGHDGALSHHDRLALYFSGQEAMLRMREMAVTTPMKSAPLSPRERECLQWAAQGKTDWEIGQILSLSEKNRQHLHRTRQDQVRCDHPRASRRESAEPGPDRRLSGSVGVLPYMPDARERATPLSLLQGAHRSSCQPSPNRTAVNICAFWKISATKKSATSS